MTAIGFVTTKAPKGGYSLSRITSLESGQVQTEVVAYTSSLIEAQEIEHQEKRQIFGEPAWHSYLPQQQYREPQPLMPASSVIPAAPPPSYDGSEPLPKFAQDYADGGGLIGELSRRTNGVVRAWLPALLPALFMATVWATVNLQRFV
jgi:hypothetical protein